MTGNMRRRSLPIFMDKVGHCFYISYICPAKKQKLREPTALERRRENEAIDL